MTPTAVSTVQERVEHAAGRYRTPPEMMVGPLSVGIDLGTSTCVLTVVDACGDAVYVDSRRCDALRDGVIVDFHGVVEAIRALKETAEPLLDQTIRTAATAYPPGVAHADGQACANALEQAGIECRELIDEVTASNRLLRLDEGIVVDVGAGSTGIGVYRAGRVVELFDVAGGGHQLDLILAGGLALSVEEARELKHTRGAEVLNVLRPGIERVAARISTVDADGDMPIHLVGGGLMIPGASDIVSTYLDRPVVSYRHSLLVTPLGLALEAA